MITTEDVSRATGLTKQGVLYRLKKMEEDGNGIPWRSARGKVGSIRVFTETDLKAIVNYNRKKPGRKRKDA